ncbi:carotenoid biosynthesis protein [Gluconacetobacter tumulicola]|uniref:Carotenoid biosynthesis protein n=2 Tax=Gluconacetobacter tumulicola TaxID=1017177 RepID=A0A7W4JES3_9PROT|nr:carotenoid biosynthesis protein [Gluconacetobacter tumulicola]
MRSGISIGPAILILLIILLGGGTGFVAQAIAAISIAALSAHSVLAIGWKEAATFLVVCLFITFTMENIGVLTGFPFGRYTFLVGKNLPHIGVIPIIVGPLYFGMGYASWVIANFLIGTKVDRPQSHYMLIAIPIISAFVMTQWDIVIDPSGSTLGRAWIWYDSGGYFGVPISNFLGWLLVTWVYFQIFEIFIYFRRDLPTYRLSSPLFWAFPVLLYLAAGLCHIIPFLTAASDTRLVDAAGRAWSERALQETTVVVMLFTMLPTSLLALLRLAAPSSDRHGKRIMTEGSVRTRNHNTTNDNPLP